MIAEQIHNEINEKLKAQAYSLGWTTDQYRENKEKYRLESSKLKNKFKFDLKNYMFAILGKGVSDEQFEAVFSFAWESGHSSGFNEVWLDYCEVVGLLAKFVKGNTI